MQRDQPAASVEEAQLRPDAQRPTCCLHIVEQNDRVWVVLPEKVWNKWMDGRILLQESNKHHPLAAFAL
jgi:hypothetical protein